MIIGSISRRQFPESGYSHNLGFRKPLKFKGRKYGTEIAS
jgi:hypothetical protein